MTELATPFGDLFLKVADFKFKYVKNKNTFACFFFAKIVVISLIIYTENLGTAIFKKQFSRPSFELWSNLCYFKNTSETVMRFALLLYSRRLFLPHISMLLERLLYDTVSFISTIIYFPGEWQVDCITILLSMLMILLSTLNVIRHLICGNN